MIYPALKKTLWQMLGPSIIFVALSLNGGEMLLWPNLVSNYGFSILWPIPIILLLQFMVNMEIERYTLVTGKSVEESLIGKSKWLSVVFAFTVLAALVWPAWMTTSGNLLAVIFGFEGNAVRNAGLIFAILLLISTLFIFRKKETYKVLETISKYGLIVALGIIFLVVILKFDAVLFLQGIRGLFAVGYMPDGMPPFDFVAALAYGGVAGVLNLVQSEWVKDKGYGINSLPAKERVKVDFENVESQKNYKKWFAMVNKEHFVLFVFANVFSIFLLAYLGSILLQLGSAQGFQVLVDEISVLNAYIPYLGFLFAISGILIFIMANVTILDAIGRLTHRMLLPLQNKKIKSKIIQSKFFTSNKISEIAVYIGIIILLSSLLFPQFKQPFFLLVTSASLSAFTMWLYPPLLLKLNYSLPSVARPSLIRSILVICATLFYGGMTLWALSSYIPFLVVVLLGGVVTAYHIIIIFKIAFTRKSA